MTMTEDACHESQIDLQQFADRINYLLMLMQ